MLINRIILSNIRKTIKNYQFLLTTSVSRFCLDAFRGSRLLCNVIYSKNFFHQRCQSATATVITIVFSFNVLVYHFYTRAYIKKLSVWKVNLFVLGITIEPNSTDSMAMDDPRYRKSLLLNKH
jgi:hypothetical protein